ncbi:MAG TPA: tyrosine-type recombinase/integrase [Acidimicrobiales bacterium]|nr:tyrosine-type recombinase/integrase [Acidimicrobiales bacterium]
MGLVRVLKRVALVGDAGRPPTGPRPTTPDRQCSPTDRRSQRRFLGFGEPKSAAGKRTVDLPSFPCAMLEEQLAKRAQPGVDGLVFVNTRGNSPHVSSFSSQTWKKARIAVGRPDLRWHHLRHNAVALAIAQGANPKTIQERMGHASVTVTLDRYGHLFPALGREVADDLDKVYRESLAALPPARTAALNVR